MRLSQFLFSFAKTRFGGALTRWSFAHVTDWMPLEKLRQTAQVVAFVHPRPSYKTHILIVPRRAIASFTALAPADFPVLQEMMAVAQALVAELGLDKKGYRLIVNGGAYQDVPQLHVHLVSDG